MRALAIFNGLFTEEETLRPRLVVAAGLIAYALVILLPIFGGLLYIVFLLIMILALGLLSFAALRELLPMMDPRDPDADRFIVWGALLLFIAIGWQSFGLWFFPGLALGIGILWWRAQDLFEIIPFLEGPGSR